MKTNHSIVFIDHPEIGYFILNSKGKIVHSEYCYDEIWDGAYLDLSTIKINHHPKVSFNKRENERIGKQAVYDTLSSKVSKYITNINFKPKINYEQKRRKISNDLFERRKNFFSSH